MKNMAYRISDPADLSGRGAAASAAAGIHARDDRIFLRDGKDRAVIRACVFRAGADVCRAAHSAAAAQAHRRVAGDPGGTGAHVLHRRARATAHTARKRASGVSRKRKTCLHRKAAPIAFAMGASGLSKNLVEFRRWCGERKSNHFLRRHVRLRKYCSACKRARRPPKADGACAAVRPQTPLSKRNPF